jgi:hypothetical protein
MGEDITINLVESFISQHKSQDKISGRISIFESARDFLYQIN